MTTIAPHIPFNDKTEHFDPSHPRAKADALHREINNLTGIPYAIRCRLHELASEVSMESWTRGYRAGAENYNG